MILALYVEMPGRVDRTSDLAATHQPRPKRVEARLVTSAMKVVARFDLPIRSEEHTATGAEDLARYGWEDPRPDNPRPGWTPPRLPVGPLTILRGLNDTANAIVGWDTDELDWTIRMWRVAAGARGPAEWIRKGQTVVDVASDARELVEPTSGAITLAEATTALLGAPVEGVEGVLGLYRHEGIAKLRGAAA